jgi:hypothetical protein
MTRLTVGRTADVAPRWERAVGTSSDGIAAARCSGDPFSLAWPAADTVVMSAANLLVVVGVWRS